MSIDLQGLLNISRAGRVIIDYVHFDKDNGVKRDRICDTPTDTLSGSLLAEVIFKQVASITPVGIDGLLIEVVD